MEPIRTLALPQSVLLLDRSTIFLDPNNPAMRDLVTEIETNSHCFGKT
jgi:ABC-type phosphate transport system ATPase subunit